MHLHWHLPMDFYIIHQVNIELPQMDLQAVDRILLLYVVKLLLTCLIDIHLSSNFPKLPVDYQVNHYVIHQMLHQVCAVIGLGPAEDPASDISGCRLPSYLGNFHVFGDGR